jgi:FixJ family two-component response regulator
VYSACSSASENASLVLSSSRVGQTACLIADVQMPEMSGFDVCFELSKLGKKIPTVLITENDRSRARDAEIVRYLVKPFAEADLLEGVHNALSSSREQILRTNEEILSGFVEEAKLGTPSYHVANDVDSCFPHLPVA